MLLDAPVARPLPVGCAAAAAAATANRQRPPGPLRRTGPICLFYNLSLSIHLAMSATAKTHFAHPSRISYQHHIPTRQTNVHYHTSSNRMMYDSSTEFNLNRAIESITLAQQGYKREFDKKEEIIKTLQNKIEVLQFEVRDFIEYKRLNEKDNRELVSLNQTLKHELSMEQRENELLREEISRLSQKLATSEDTLAHLESEHEKANHIIKNLLKKLQNKPQVTTTTASGMPKTI